MGLQTEVFYTPGASNKLSVRRGGETYALGPRRDLTAYEASLAEEKRGKASLSAELPFALLADALDDDARALRLHHAFRRRVVSLLPDRWTMSRSRIRAYANMIEQCELVGIGLGS
jgi:Family of unknown function (DUF6166)